ncbi:MAG: ATP-binding protein, partial [Clostridia bacterium]|nr:ATP-binding protein [Clostridia bacterium]
MNITSGKIACAQKVVLYGPEGIGKSTFAARFPDPLFIDTEGSTKHMDVRRFDTPTSWSMLLEQVKYTRDNPQECKTLVIDTADWAEKLCIAQLLQSSHKNGIEDFGYGAGYTYAAERFGEVFNL